MTGTRRPGAASAPGAAPKYLGHASPAITMTVYAHAVPGAKKRAAERLGSILAGARAATAAPAEGAATG